MAIIQHITRFLFSARFALFLIVASLAGVFLILFNTSPIELGPAGMLMAFGVFYIWFFSLIVGFIHAGQALRGRNRDDRDEKERAPSGRTVTLAAAWAFAPLIMLALQSIGQLDAISLALVILFEALASVYIFKR